MAFTSSISTDYPYRTILVRYNALKADARPIVDWCVEHGIDPFFMEAIVDAFADPQQFPKEHLLSFPTDLIIDYLERTHTYYLEKLLPEIEQTLFEWIRSTGGAHPIPLYLLEQFGAYRSDLEAHIADEEARFFPYVKQLLAGERSGDYSLQEFVEEHEHHDDHLVRMRELIGKAQQSGMQVLPYRVLLSKLELLERDLQVHALVEDEVLVEKVRRML